MGMAIRVERMEIGKTGEDRLRWPITTLQGFLRRDIPLYQIRVRISLSRKPLTAVQDVQFAAMIKINLRLQVTVGQLANRINQAQGQVAAANVLARQAQAAVQGVVNVDYFRPAAPSKYPWG
jgi:hypothetical protein